MKRLYNLLAIILGTLGVVIFILSCEPKGPDPEEYDINFPRVEITSFSPASALIETDVTITGSNLNTISEDEDGNLSLFIGDPEIQIMLDDIVSRDANTLVFTVPRLALSGVIRITNSYEKTTISDSILNILYPATVINTAAINDTIFLSEPFVITGTNMDMISSVEFGGASITVDRGNESTQTTLSLDLSEENISNPAVLDFTSVDEDFNFNAMLGITVLADYPWATLLAVAPDTASEGGTVFMSFADTTYIDLISSIQFASENNVGTYVDAAYSISGTIATVTVPVAPADTLSGSFRIRNPYRSQVYSGLITVNP